MEDRFRCKTQLQIYPSKRVNLNPFDPKWEQYSEQLRQERMWESMRYRKQWATLYMSQSGLCAQCGCALTDETGWHDHHLEYRMHGGTDALSNRVLLHPECHRQVHSVTSPWLSRSCSRQDFVCRLEPYAGKLARTVLRGPFFRKEEGYLPRPLLRLPDSARQARSEL